MVWHRISVFILRNRRTLLLLLLLGTVLMGYQTRRLRLSYELASTLPPGDPDFLLYEAFKARYGEDGNVLVIGAETPAMYSLRNFNGWYDLRRTLKRIDGIRDVVSNAGLVRLVRDDSTGQFRFQPLVPRPPTSQAEVDGIRRAIAGLPFYDGFVADSAGQAHLMAVTFRQDALNTKDRIALVRQITEAARAFGKTYGIPVHLSGMPYIRTELSARVSQEMRLFMGLAFAVTALILLLAFRSLQVVLVSLGVVGIGVLWTTGYLVLFDYRITLLTGLIPPLIIVLGIPNAIFLLNTCQNELSRHGGQRRARQVAAAKMAETTFFANITTSIGFFVFYFTSSPLLLEFGLVAALGLMTTFALSLVLIPIAFSYLPPPSARQRGHLEGRRITAFLNGVDHLVHRRRAAIYTGIGLAVGLGIVGLLRIRAVGYVVDDLPKNDPIYTDLKFFERHFRGVMPFEVNIDTRLPGRVLSPQTLTKIRRLQRAIEAYPEFSRPLSVVEAIQFFYQSYRGGDPQYYTLPPAIELARLTTYAPPTGRQPTRLSGFIDSTHRYTRVRFQMADVGTVRLNELLARLQPRADSIFNVDPETGRRLPLGDQYDVRITGSSVVFTKGNAYLLTNLQESTALAIGLVSVILGLLLRDVRSVLLAVLPGIVPLLITAGLMGFFQIPLKPSTILIFSIAFGLSSGGTIYFLIRYRDERRTQGRGVSEAVSRTIRHTGVSMVCTAFMLFVGFAIFTASTFGGTVTLGLLVSLTLLMGMASNLILLPAFLLSLDKRRTGPGATRGV